MAIWKLDLVYLVVGAVAGAYLRYRIGSDQLTVYGIPLTILMINFVGSLILGISMTTIQKFALNQGYVVLLGVGFCGSFTTMSSFALESSSLLLAGRFFAGVVDILLNVGLSLFAIVLGRILVLFVLSFFA